MSGVSSIFKTQVKVNSGEEHRGPRFDQRIMRPDPPAAITALPAQRDP